MGDGLAGGDLVSGDAALSLEVAAATDVGCKRSNNEDTYGYDLRQQLYVVCDGMGGVVGGEIASATAVETLIETFEAESRAEAPRPVEERLHRAIHAANRGVRKAALESDRLDGMGTTLVCACFDGGRILIGNVGDSRAYFIRGGACFQVTHDHSFVSEQLRKGLMTEEAAAASELQSVITRAIGVADTVEPDLFAAELKVGDMVLLTSDGLTRYVEPEEIGSMIGRGGELKVICQGLIDAAKQRGGADNITCLLLRVAGGPAVHAEALRAGATSEGS